MSIRKKKGVGLVTLVVAGAVAMGSYAFTATNTLPATHVVGSGSSATQKFTVSGVRWTADTTTLDNVRYVDFAISPNADVVRVQYEDANADGTGAASGTVILCDAGGAGTDSSPGTDHTYTVDDPSGAGATTTQVAAAGHPVCDLGASGVPNADVTKLTVYAEQKTA